MDNQETIQVSFRLRKALVDRMRSVSANEDEIWPPPPSQTEIVTRGIMMALDELDGVKQRRRRAKAD